MNLEVKIETIDRTSLIEKGSFKKTDVETSRVDSATFSYLKYGSRTWTPARDDEIIVTDTDLTTKVFAGKIISVKGVMKKNGTVNFTVGCKDYTEDFDDELVAQTFEAQTIQQIIDAIKPSGFTSTNVTGSLLIDRITFNYVRKSTVLKDLAALVGYHWYIDYDKDIHFFPKNTETAPFDVDDSSVNVIGGSLWIDQDMSQLRNKVTILGGETVGASRSESYVADGDQAYFKLANKFSSLPVIKLNTVAQAVGVAPLNQFIDGPYDVLWDFNRENIQFDTIPTASDAVEITGTPLADVAVVIEDPASIATFGVKEHKITDKTIKDTDTARQRANSELTSYAAGVSSGSFRTYTDGLRSGMSILIDSTLLGINERFIIKKVSMTMHNETEAIYTVSLVSNKIVGVIEFLQDLLRKDDKLITTGENAGVTIAKSISETITCTESITLEIEKAVWETITATEQIRQNPWGTGTVIAVLGPYFPTNDADSKRAPYLDRGAVLG